MLKELKQREAEGNPIRVGLVGAGAMGLGIALQIGKTPGMELVFVADYREQAARAAEAAYGGEVEVGADATSLIEKHAGRMDVFVEATNTIGPAADYCLAALEAGAHVVLMNAEVDLMLGRYLARIGEEKGLVVTSDAGDQHGVLVRMCEEIEMWGFDLVQVGNIKGFLDRYATPESIRDEAEQRHLSPVQCCAYTDGTKLSIEMALVANATGTIPLQPGMVGPVCDSVNEVLDYFNFDQYGDQGRVDYILKAVPGGGVYVVARSDDPLQARYMDYYKMGKPPYYVFYRPYHLCHLETPRAIALAALWDKPVLTQEHGRLTDVFTYAKRDLKAGELIEEGIGGDAVYGLIDATANGEANDQIPIGLLEPSGEEKGRVKRDVAKDQIVTFADIELPGTRLVELFNLQQEQIGNGK